MDFSKAIITFTYFIALFTSCGPRLQIKIESQPSAAIIIFEDVDTGLRTPAYIDKKFNEINQEDGLASFNINLKYEDKHASGRILSWDGGFPIFPVFIRRAESLDGSAWFSSRHGNEDVLSVQFPVADKYYLVMHWSEKPKKYYSIDDVGLNYKSDNEVFLLPIGEHTVDSELWKAVIASDEKYCVQLFEWGGTSDGEIFLCFQPDHFLKLKYIDDNKSMEIAHPGSINVDGKQLRMIFEKEDKRKCEIFIQYKIFTPLHIRVTSS